jgi:3-oxoacyl-[acyl-carrier protein] reductase
MDRCCNAGRFDKVVIIQDGGKKMGSLAGKRALVTGGATGIGAAITLEMARQGARVAVHRFRSDITSLKQQVEAMGSELIELQGDLTDEAVVKQVTAEAASALGGLDILINNAGDMIARQSLEGMEREFFTRVMDVNMTSTFLICREAAPHLAKAGGAAIVNMSSLAGRKGGAGGSLVYSTAKGAVITFTRSLAGELAPQGIRVNCIAPGLILGTNFHQTYTKPEAVTLTIEGIPLGRAGTPEEVASAVLFLASQYDGFITGITLDINGGVYVA